MTTQAYCYSQNFPSSASVVSYF